MNDLAARASLRKRFRGIDDQIGRVVAEMADYCVKPEPLRVWSDIRPVVPEGLSVAVAWTVHVIAEGPAIPDIRLPVIPDHANPHPTKLIRATDRPYEFPSMAEAERVSAEAINQLSQQLRNMI